MSTPSEVFVVTFGEYSDYHIDSVWLTRQEAEAAAGANGEVECYGIGEHPRSVGSFSHYADVFPDGTVANETTSEWATILTEPRAERCCWEGGDRIGIRVDQPTRERADKVFSEVKAQVLADFDLGLTARQIATRERRDGMWRPVNQ